MSKKLIIVSVIVALVVGIVIGAIFTPSDKLGGAVRLSQDWFTVGLKAGSTGQFQVSSAGVLTTSGATNATGNLTTTAKAAIGTATVGDGELTVYEDTGTSTISMSGVKGCIQMITTSGSTTKIVVTGTTSPAFSLLPGTCE